MKTRIIQTALVAGAAAGMGLAGIIPATAAVSSHHSGRSHDVTATTRLRDRQDSGGTGNWAVDRFTRVATLTPAGTGTLANCGITTTPKFTVTFDGYTNSTGLGSAGGISPDYGWAAATPGTNAELSDGSTVLTPGTDYTPSAWTPISTSPYEWTSTITLKTPSAWKAGDTLTVKVPSGDSATLSAPTVGTVSGVTYTVPVCNAYTAALKDNGTFTTIPLAFTPNQGTGDTGLKLPARPVNGQMNGYGDFTTFYATAAPDASLVPRHVTGNAITSGTWPQLFFPVGTTLTGVNEATFGYYYNAQVKTTTFVCSGRRHHHRQRCTRQVTVQNEHWADTSGNGAGQLPGDGNITG